jgi:hypothetical protein
MSLSAVFRYQFYEHMRRLRWLMPLPVGLLLGYWAVQVIRSLLPEPATRVQGNALEAFLWAFGKPEIVYFIATACFIYLISDLTPEKSCEQQVILRLSSRSAWWTGKILWMGVMVCVYALLLFGSFLFTVGVRLPFSTEWSLAGINNSGIPLGYVLKNGSPISGVVHIMLFLMVGWFSIGLLMMTINQVTRSRRLGFLAGALILLVANLGSITGGPIGGQGWESYLLIQNHLEYTPLWSPARVIPEVYSWIYWGIWITACLLAGFSSVRTHDFQAVGR